jgi:AhpD family alkylhydroperoxidase
MPLMTMPTREQVDADVRALWDECERTYPAFKHLWATQANSPIIFRHVWGQLLELKHRSPVAARHFEIGIVVASTLNRCRYCVSHHAPLAEAAGLTDEQVESLARLTLEPLSEDHDFPRRAGFAPDDSLVVDLAYVLVWSGIFPHVADGHPRVVQRLRRRLLGRLREYFSECQIEELTWRIVQCVAFNWHNDFFELDLEPEVTPRETAVERPASRV